MGNIIGHSLGAHVCGYAGDWFRYLSKHSIARIDGLDPAGPLFLDAKANNRLDKGDADFVSIIHTDAFGAGIDFNIGHADFWPNGGKNQPGCEGNPDCNHDFSHQLWAYSVL